MKQKCTRFRNAVFAVPLTIATAGLLIAAAPTSKNIASQQAPSTPALSTEAIEVASTLSDAFRNVAKHVLPSVVAIENRPDVSWQSVKSPAIPGEDLQDQENPFKGTPLEDMFRRQAPGNSARVPRSAPRPRGIGSGVIIDSSGVVLTNNHVVAGGGEVVIKTSDGREFIATEVLTDPQTDIAVVKFAGDDRLVAAKLGDSDAMAVGDWVVALGQPFGLESTVTAGIVSAKNRGIGITDRENFIQTDAAINPGNSGGPLVNLHGEVIGINTAISSRDGGNNGVGFAVPSNLAHWVSHQLIDKGSVTRSYLGVSIQPVNYELGTQLGVPPRSGVAVTNVFADTPAAKSGLRSGDVIVKFGGIAVATPQQLQLAVERAPLGTELTVEIVRDGEPVKLDYVPEAAPNDFGANRSRATRPEGVKMNSLGMEVAPMSADVAQQLGIKTQGGVVVTSVQDQSPAAEAGLEPGMVVVQVNRQNVSTASEFAEIVQNDADGSLLLLIRTAQGSRFVVINR